MQLNDANQGIVYSSDSGFEAMPLCYQDSSQNGVDVPMPMPLFPPQHDVSNVPLPLFPSTNNHYSSTIMDDGLTASHPVHNDHIAQNRYPFINQGQSHLLTF